MRQASPVWADQPRPDHRSTRLVLGYGPRMFREAVRVLLNLDRDIQVVAEAGSAGEVVACVLAHDPDVVLLDVELEPDGVQTARAIGAAGLRCRCLLVETGGGRRRARRRRGGPWFVLDDASASALAAAVRVCAAGHA